MRSGSLNGGGVLQVTLKDAIFSLTIFKVTNKKQNIKLTDISLTQPSVKQECKESWTRLPIFYHNKCFRKGTNTQYCLYNVLDFFLNCYYTSCHVLAQLDANKLISIRDYEKTPHTSIPHYMRKLHIPIVVALPNGQLSKMIQGVRY